MVNKNIIILIEIVIIISLIAFTFYEDYNKTGDDGKTKVYFGTEFQTGAVVIDSFPYLCGYNDDVCPDDYSDHKPVCIREDPDC